ncbi:integral membrane protein [Pseudoclavibacter chungangensis]|uniref:DUF3817 domain-containing protein n=1 Tax=Pseudoclavibacter chungangensis TaxID=587635 RepID=UPI0015CA0F7C|nr:DUF3817 domain-containing protein [Pseudoclavibacter chungangensis]NYJ68548.1 integral membrane protein [Pseudoclavibacter chungangensis]
MTPRTLLRTVSIGEAATWALLLFGMWLKYGARTTDAVVTLAGSLHGGMFIAYLACTMLVGLNQRWPWHMFLLGGIAAVPPFATLLFDWFAERRRMLAGGWRTVAAPQPVGATGDVTLPGRRPAPLGFLDPLLYWAVRHPITLVAIVVAFSTVAVTMSLTH